MKWLKKFLGSFAVAILLVITCLSPCVFAEEYSNRFPDYLPTSACAFIEVRTSELGEGTLIFSIDKQFDTFSFVRNGYNISNQTNSNVSGYFIKKSNKASYTVRLRSLDSLQYQQNSGIGGSQYVDLTVTQILNTNVQFTDLTENGRGNSINKISWEALPIFIALVLLCFELIFVGAFLLIKGAKV